MAVTRLSLRLVLAVLAVAAAGCETRPARPLQLVEHPAPPVQMAAARPVAAAPPATPGPVAASRHWSAYREFTFNQLSSMVTSADLRLAADIAAYARDNPLAHFRVEGPGTDDLSQRRIEAVRNTLIDAGVQDARIETGALGNLQLARDRLVQVQLSDR